MPHNYSTNLFTWENFFRFSFFTYVGIRENSSRENFFQQSTSLFIFRGHESFLLLFLITIMAWNLSGLAIILFDTNQRMVVWLFFSKVLMSSLMVFSAVEIVLSSPKMSSSEFDIQRKRSFMNILIKIGPSIVPLYYSMVLVPPESKIWNILWVLFTLMFLVSSFISVLSPFLKIWKYSYL